MSVHQQLTVDAAVNAMQALDIKVPKDLAAALAVREAIVTYDGPAAIDEYEVMTVAPADVAKLLDRATDAQIRRGAVAAVRGPFRDRAIGRCMQALNASTDTLLAAAGVPFRDAAKRFENAYRQLPAGGTDATAVLQAGLGEPFVIAQGMVSILDRCATLRQNLPVAAVLDPVAAGLTYAVCADSMVATEASRVDIGGPFGRWGNMLAVDGVAGLQWHDSVADLNTARAKLPTATMKQERVGQHGWRPVKVVAS